MKIISFFRKSIIPFALVQFLASCAATASFAATSTGSFTVTSTVGAACSVSADTGVTMTLADPTGHNILTVVCTNGSAWTVQFVGLHDAADFFTHKMSAGGANYISYVLTGTATAPIAFGEAPKRLGGNPTYNVSGTGTGAAQTVSITSTAATLGVDSFQYAPVGSYSDTITVTIAF